MSGLAFLNIGNLSFAVAPFGIEPTTKSGKDNSKFAGKNGHTPQGPVTKWQSSMEWGLDAKNRYEAPKKAPNYGVAVLGSRQTSADANQRNSTWKICNLRVICSTESTFLDVLERHWMVGRVGIEPTTN